MMNKQQKEVISATLEDEANILKKLRDNYTIALADIKNNIKKLQSNPLTQSKAYQLDFQKQLEKQISGIIDKLQGDNFTSIAEYLNICYNQAFLGTMYDIHAQGIPLIFPLNQKQVLKAVQKTGDDIKLSAKLGNSDSLKKQVISEMQRGFSTDMSYTDIARNISNCGEADFNRSMRIARTEGHRVQNEAKLDTYQNVKKKGADIVKQWDATLDGDTRKNHRKLDGQIRELEEDFEIDGKSAPCPGKFNDPAEDCNCRCAMLQRARWALDENELKTLQERAEYFGLDKSDSFAEFKEKYLNAVEKSGGSGMIKEVIEPQTPIEYRESTKDDYSKLGKNMRKKVAKEDINQLMKHEKSDGSPGGYVATHNYSNINSNMRNDNWSGNQLDADDEKTIEALKKAIKDNMLDDDYILTRYVNADYLTSVFGVKQKSLKRSQPDEVISNSILSFVNSKKQVPRITEELQVNVGKIVKDKAFLSTSMLPTQNIMKDKAVLIKIKAPKGTNAFIPNNRKESECILMPGAERVVESIVFDEAINKWVITEVVK